MKMVTLTRLFDVGKIDGLGVQGGFKQKPKTSSEIRFVNIRSIVARARQLHSPASRPTSFKKPLAPSISICLAFF